MLEHVNDDPLTIRRFARLRRLGVKRLRAGWAARTGRYAAGNGTERPAEEGAA
jgi:hypothetical protein